MSVAESVTRRLAKMFGDLADLFEDNCLTEEERAAINEAARLADQFSDVKPDHLVESGNRLFNIYGRN